MAWETYSFRFFDSNIWYFKIIIIYKHLNHIYKYNDSSRIFITILWKAQMHCFIGIVVSQVVTHVSHSITVTRNWSPPQTGDETDSEVLSTYHSDEEEIEPTSVMVDSSSNSAAANIRKKLKTPTPFSGKRDDLRKFLQEIKIYLLETVMPILPIWTKFFLSSHI